MSETPSCGLSSPQGPFIGATAVVHKSATDKAVPCLSFSFTLGRLVSPSRDSSQMGIFVPPLPSSTQE